MSSIIGMTKANVLPLPVTASAATSLFFNRYGIHSAYAEYIHYDAIGYFSSINDEIFLPE